jgi:hydroxymethylpyrimidine pyrophosphatase-like HAD family hydrolase
MHSQGSYPSAPQPTGGVAGLECVVLDLDGSAMSDDEGTPSELISLVRENSTVRWVLATGRSFASAANTELAKALPKGAPHVFDGGSTLMSLSGTSFLQHWLSPCEISIFFDNVDEGHLDYIFASTEDAKGMCWTSPRSAAVKLPPATRANCLREYRRLLDAVPVSKLSIRARCAIQLPNTINAVICGNKADVLPCGIDKGTGMRFIFDRLSIAPSRSAFVFNDVNDLPLLAHPYFRDIVRIKVGSRIPTVPSEYSIAAPRAVASLLASLLKS